MINFTISSTKKISKQFLKLNHHDFISASEFVRNLPYLRNANKENELCVLADNGGTCSTKHTLLKRLADENNFSEIKLILGIFKMNSQNSPKISKVLEQYLLKEIPEAHNYLRLDSEVLDFTRRNAKPEDFVKDLMEEIEIGPSQITTFKIAYHQKFIEKYLKENPQIPYSSQKFWKIREECILALQQ